MTFDTKGTESETAANDRDGNTVRAEWDRSSRPTVAIAEAIAEATGREPTALPSLYYFIDPEALDAVLRRAVTRKQQAQVSFTYDGVPISVGSDGTLSIRIAGATGDRASDE